LDNPIYVALSREMILRRQMDIVANNLANADTPAFKVENLIVKTDPQPMNDPNGGPDVINYALDVALGRNFGQGALAQTGSSLDMAIEGDGFFKVTTAAGERYTRDGRFSLDSQGRVVTKQGQPVQGEGGDIVVDPIKGQINVAHDGTISQGTERLGKIAVVSFSDNSVLSKEGDGLYSNKSNLGAGPAQDVVVHQGMIEGSNVQSILQITDMIEVSRAYERMSKLIDQTTELDRQAISRLGRVVNS
jgi:flagellar basal-body rod protein FlgF